MKHCRRIVGLAVATLMLALPVALRADPAPPSPKDAPIALLLDISTGQVLDAREADRRFLPASITKVMSAFVAFELLKSGQLQVDKPFTVSPQLAQDWSGKGSTLFLRSGDEVPVDTLLRGITTVSANDGAILLAEGAAGSVDKWVARMNAAAADIGMNDSHFGTPNGWPDAGSTYVTAHDLGLLASAMIGRHPDLYKRYFGHRSFNYNGMGQDNHDPITGVVRGADGIKTGYTREAGYNFLGSAERDGQRLVMVLAGTESEDERARIAREYIEWGFSAFERRLLFDKGAPIGEALVQDGNSRAVALRAAIPVIASLPKGENPRIALSLRYRGPIKAPIAQGQQVAELLVSIDGFAPYAVPLEAAGNVAEANPWRRLVNGVLGWFS